MLSERQRSRLKSFDQKASEIKAYRWIRRAVAYLGGREPVVLLILFLVVAATWGFVQLADEVLEGDTEAFDKWAVRAMRKADSPAEPIGPAWVQELGRDATALGGMAWLVFFTLVVAGYLWLDRKVRLMVFLLAATTSGMLLSLMLKQVFSRPRPDIVPHLSHVHTASFPSGHSMLSAVVYLTLGALLATALPRPRLKIYVLAIALFLSFVVGVSRVYMGVHYPTDVLAGWTAGLAWALACWGLAHWLQQRGKVEPEDPVEPKDPIEPADEVETKGRPRPENQPRRTPNADHTAEADHTPR